MAFRLCDRIPSQIVAVVGFVGGLFPVHTAADPMLFATTASMPLGKGDGAYQRILDAVLGPYQL